MFIDIHVHTTRVPGFPRLNGETYARPEDLIAGYDEENVRITIK